MRIGDDSALPDELPGKFPASPFVAGKSETTSKAKSQQPRPRTRLAEALERARQNKSKGVAAASAADSRCQDAKTKPARQDSLQEKKPDEDQWEEIEDDNDDVDPDADRDMNVTVDLNEPQSRSGKYWKSQFEDYHAEAKAEMGKLVRYKALAKSYAQQKDSEALGLHARLREEQEKVRRMERQLAASGRQVTAKAKREGGHYDAELVEDLARQTSLAREYKEQVKDLELLLQDMEHEDDQEQDAEGRAGTRQHRVTSPRTHTTLLEAQRELRRARIQVKELERLKEERDRLKSELRFAEQRASKLAEENKKLAADLAQSGSKVSGLEKEASALKTQARQRDRELRKLKEDHEKLKENAKARYLEAEQVVHKKNDKISSLKDELQSLKSAGLASRVSARAKELERKLRSRGETLEPRDKEDALTLMEEAEEESTLLRGELDKLRQLSVKKGLIAPPRQAGVVRASRRESPEEQVAVLKALSRGAAKAPASSGMPREKAESEASNRASGPSVLSDRGNIQNTRSSSSTGQDSNFMAFGQQGKDKLDVVKPKSKASDDVVITSRTSWPPSTFDQPSQRDVPARSASPRDENRHHRIDLVESRFARLGVPDVNASTMWSMNTSRTTLPADRRAAAIARLERKKAARTGEVTQTGKNKENVGPRVGFCE